MYSNNPRNWPIRVLDATVRQDFNSRADIISECVNMSK